MHRAKLAGLSPPRRIRQRRKSIALIGAGDLVYEMDKITVVDGRKEVQPTPFPSPATVMLTLCPEPYTAMLGKAPRPALCRHRGGVGRPALLHAETRL